MASCDASEPNNNLHQATRLTPNATQSGHYFCGNVDQDWFYFTVSQAQTYELDTLNLLGGADTYMKLYSSDGNLIEYNDDGAGALASKIRRRLNPGTYYVQLHPYRYPGLLALPSNKPIPIQINPAASQGYSIRLRGFSDTKTVFVPNTGRNTIGGW
jgi:hypothetical protein